MQSDDEERGSPRLGDTTAFLLIGVGRLVQRRLEAALQPEGITLRHLGALGHLRRTPGLSVSDLARKADVTAQSMHATVRQLVERGAIDPGPVGGRGRSTTLAVTREGVRLLDLAGAAGQTIDAELLADLPASLRDALLAVVRAELGSTVGLGRADRPPSDGEAG